METKLKSHGIRRIFYDILRDLNSTKYSMTKFAALIGLIVLVATVVMSLIVMWQNKKIDHVLIVELIGFVLTLLGFKNSFGYKGKEGSITTNGAEIPSGSEPGEPADPDEGKMKFNKIDTPSDKTNDLKG
jgi:hypothetical protein